MPASNTEIRCSVFILFRQTAQKVNVSLQDVSGALVVRRNPRNASQHQESVGSGCTRAHAGLSVSLGNLPLRLSQPNVFYVAIVLLHAFVGILACIYLLIF